MGQPKARPKRTAGEGPGAEDGPPPPCSCWQAPPDGLFDVIVPQLTSKQFVVVQLVCKDWSRSARYCLKEATPKRPDVDLSKLVKQYPNLTQLNLTHVEGLSTRMLTPLRQLTALRELCLSNVAIQQPSTTTDARVADAPVQCAGRTAAAAGAGPSRVVYPRGQRPSTRPGTRPRTRAAMAGSLGGSEAHSPTSPEPHAGKPPSGANQAGKGTPGPCKQAASPATAAAGTTAAAERALQHRHNKTHQPSEETESKYTGKATGTAAAAQAAAAVMAGGNCGAAVGSAAAADTASPPPSPASHIFGGLGDVLMRLSKLQADLCPALTADVICLLPSLTDLTLDTLVAPGALQPLGRLKCLAVKKLANAESLDRLSGLTQLLVNSDSSCASEFLPVCTRLPGLQSLTFKTSSTKILQHPDPLCWQGFSRLTSLDLRAPAECLKPGLPELAELGCLRSLAVDLYCASEEELMVTVVAPPNLDSLFVSSDRSRSGGVIDVHPNSRLRSLRLRLYWTALNLVLPEGLPEPSPLPEPISEDEEEEEDYLTAAGIDYNMDLGLDADAAAAGPASGGRRPTAAAAGGGSGGRRRVRRSGDLEPDLDLVPVTGRAAEVAGERPGPWSLARAAMAAATGGTWRRWLRRRRASSDGGGGGTARGTPDADAGGGGISGDGRSPRRRLRRSSGAGGPSAGGNNGSGGDEETGLAAAADAAGVRGGRGAGPSSATAAAVLAVGAGGNAVDNDSEQQPVANSAGRDRQLADAAAGVASRQLRSSERRRRLSNPRSAGREGAAAAGGAAAIATPVSGGRRASGASRRSTGGGGGAAAVTPATSGAGVGSVYGSPNGATAAGAGVGGVAIPELHLEELCLDACYFLLYGSLVPLLRQYPRLTSLTLDNCLALENGELMQLCELTGLRKLSLSGLHLVSDNGLRALGRLTCLTQLRLKGLRKLSVHAAQAYMRQKPIVRRHEEVSGSFLPSLAPLSSLRCLALKHLHTAREGALAAGLGALRQLTRLEVKDVRSMTDAVLQSLGRHSDLRELSVLHCEAVTLRGRNALVRALGPRVALDFEGCSLPDITRPCALPTSSTQAQLIDDDQVSSSNHPRRSCQHSNQH